MGEELLAAIRAERLAGNPIIQPSLSASIGTNIKGPSLLRVPDWVEDPLGKYYLYFAHYQGDHIRLAYANHLEGPWQIVPDGALSLSATDCTGHVASPDVVLDEDAREFRMYFHGIYEKQQLTFVARSADGLQFAAGTTPVGPFHMRVFRHGEYWYGYAKNRHTDGMLVRSSDGIEPFEEGPHFLPRVRHVALLPHGPERLIMFYTRAGDAPESILATCFDLREDWLQWQPQGEVIVLAPEESWEGARLPVAPSASGSIDEPVCQLRDPAIFRDGGHVYLIYSVAGESGLAVAELFLPAAPVAGEPVAVPTPVPEPPPPAMPPPPVSDRIPDDIDLGG